MKGRWPSRLILLVVLAGIGYAAWQGVLLWHKRERYRLCLQQLEIVGRQRYYTVRTVDVVDEWADAKYQILYMACERCRIEFERALP